MPVVREDRVAIRDARFREKTRSYPKLLIKSLVRLILAGDNKVRNETAKYLLECKSSVSAHLGEIRKVSSLQVSSNTDRR